MMREPGAATETTATSSGMGGREGEMERQGRDRLLHGMTNLTCWEREGPLKLCSYSREDYHIRLEQLTPKKSATRGHAKKNGDTETG